MNSSNQNRYSTAIQRLRKEYRKVNQNIPTSIDELPLLKELVDLFKRSQPLRNSTALLIQHQCTNHYAQAMALIELGIQPDRLFWIDIPYSSHKEVRERLYKLGIPRKNFRNSSDYQILHPFSPYMRSRVEKSVRSLLAYSPKKPLIVLDDGSYFLEALSGFKKQFQEVVVVEQTTRGLIKIEQSATLKNLSNKIRIINVARSWPKKYLEPPFIGLAVCTSLRKKIAFYFGKRLKGNCLVLGYGVIGEQVAEFLLSCLSIRKKNIYVYDTDKTKINIARKAGFSIWNRGNLNTKFKLIIGCSGKSSFSVGDRVYLEDGAVLTSASSGSVELSREEFIELADTSPVDDIWIERKWLTQNNCHSDIKFNLVGSKATFLNGGFPINFDGRISTIPWRHIQITPTLMIAGAVQGVRTKEPGIIDLCPFLCSWIDTRFKELIGQESVVLKKRFCFK